LHSPSLTFEATSSNVKLPPSTLFLLPNDKYLVPAVQAQIHERQFLHQIGILICHNFFGSRHQIQRPTLSSAECISGNMLNLGQTRTQPQQGAKYTTRQQG
jgi:hypothetical protein